MANVSLPIWLVLIYPVLALSMYLLMMYYIRKNGAKRILHSITSGEADNVMIQFWQRYGKDMIIDIIKVGGPIIIDSMMTKIDARLKGHMGPIKKDIMKNLSNLEEQVGPMIESILSSKLPVLGGLASQMGMSPKNPLLAQLLLRSPKIQELEAKAQEKLGINSSKDINGAEANGNVEMSQMFLQNLFAQLGNEALLQQALQIQSEEAIQIEGQG